MSSKRGSRILIAAGGLVATAVALAGALHRGASGPARWACPVGGLLIGMLLAGLLGAVAWPWLQKHTGATRFLWAGLALLGGTVAAQLITPTSLQGPHLPRQELVITATGERPPASSGSEVWFLGVYDENNRVGVPGQISADASWETRENAWVSYQQQPATLRWRGSALSPLTVRLTEHPWSGVAEITWAGQTQRVVLHSTEYGTRAVNLPAAVSTADRARLTAYRTAVVGLRGLLLAATGLLLITLHLRVSGAPCPTTPMLLARGAQAALSLGVVWWATTRMPPKGEFCLATFLANAQSNPPKAIDDVRFRRAEGAFFQTHLPPGAVVLCAPWLDAWLPMLHDVHVLAAERNSAGVQLRLDRKRALRALRQEDLPPAERRALLERYDLRWAVDRSAHRDFAWLEAWARQTQEGRGYLIVELDPAKGAP